MRNRLAALGALLLVIVSIPAPIRVAAEPLLLHDVGANILAFSQQDANNDGQPDVTIIDAAFVTDHDRITVYDGDGDMRATERWWEATSFKNDTWDFDIGADGTSQLIIRFAVENGHSVAYLSDDSDGDGAVAHDVTRGVLRVTESPYPTLRIESTGDWLFADGSLNPGLTWTMDGCGTCTMLPSSARNTLKQQFLHDGRPDFVGGIVDTDHDGVPDYLYSVMTTKIPSSYGVPRDLVRVNSGSHRPANPSGYGFWPFLAGPHSIPGSRFFDAWPQVSVNWGAGKISGAPAVSGYPIESGYSIYSLSPWSPDEVNDASFENPMAYYDLAGDQDGNPELHIRVEYTQPDDSYFFGGRANGAEDVRFSWNQTNTSGLSWDYKLGLAGTHAIDTVQQYGPFRARVLPFDQLPHWVTSNAWEWQTFVAREAGNYASSEGIYEWSALDGVAVAALGDPRLAEHPDPGSMDRQRRYLRGQSTEPPDSLYSAIGAGLRGEVSIHPDAQPELYFSPVDARLHLAGASRGLYNVDGSQRVIYQSLAGDGYIDSWQVFDGDQAVAQLAQRPGALLHAGDGRITLLKADVPREAFRTLPPGNHDEWAQLGQQLDANRRVFAGDDLGAMFDQFSGQRLTLSGGALSDLRLTDAGFRFVLDLQPGFDLGNFPVSGITGPGRFVLDYDDATGQFTAQPSSPPSPVIEAVDAPAPATALQPVRVSISLANRGLEDARTVPLIVTATRPEGSPRVIARKTVDLLGLDQPVISASWTPPATGDWTVTARLYPPEGVVERTADVSVAAVDQPSWRSVATVGWPETVPLAYIVLLLGLIALPAGGGLLLLRRQI